MKLHAATDVLGQAVEEAYAATTHAWMREHRAGRSIEQAWVEDVNEVHVSVQLKKGGRATLQASVIARLPWKSSTEVFRLHFHHSGAYQLHGTARS